MPPRKTRRTAAKRPQPDARTEKRWSGKGASAPRLPHERDESVDGGQGVPSELMKRAREDIETGKSETDRGEATDEVYGRTLRGRAPGQERDSIESD